MKNPFLIPGLTAAGLLICAALLRLPYGYYTFMRWCVCAASIYCVVLAGDSKRDWPRLKFAVLWPAIFFAIVFNPLAPLQMQRQTWVGFDIAAAIFLAAVSLIVKWGHCGKGPHS